MCTPLHFFLCFCSSSILHKLNCQQKCSTVPDSASSINWPFFLSSPNIYIYIFYPAVGCMAEGLKFELLEREKLVDVLAGPDSYRDLPRLLSLAHGGQRASNVLLSLEETYADVMPVHRTLEGHSAFV